MRKRLLTFLLLLLSASLIMSLIACGSEKEPDETKEAETENTGSETAKEDESATGTEEDELRENQEKITDFLTLYGRTVVQGKELKLFWTNSGFAFRCKGTGASVRINPSSTNSTYYGYVNVYVDGAFEPASTICVTTAGNYDLISGLPEGIHTIEVRKRNEAAYGQSATLSFSNLKVTDGAFCVKPPEKPDFKIEFIGDSITCGFGNMIYDGTGNYTTATEDGTMTYAALTAKALNADISVIARSGICYVQGSDKDSMFGEYEKTASLPGAALSTEPWNFSSDPADVVVINLGTNDGGARIDGKSITAATYTSQAVDFIEMVRRNNPDALIVWAYGLMGTGMAPALEAAVQQVKKAGDDDVLFLKMNPLNQAKEGIGTHGHPSIQTDIERALTLAQFISDEIGRDVDRATLLKAQVYYAENYWLKDVDKYIPTTVEVLEESIENAKAVLAQQTAGSDYEALRKAIVSAHEGLLTTEDMSDVYYVIDTCDSMAGWTSGGKNKGLDDENQIGGEGCFTTEGNLTQNNIYFMHNPGQYHITMPEDFENWYIEMWIYMSDPSVISGGSCLEFSQVVDKIEFAWDVGGLGLQEGWNHIQLKISGAAKTAIDQFKTLENLRFFLFLNGETEFKIDDIVLSKGKYAADRAELKLLLEQAETIESPSWAQKEAIAFAKEATSQRMVDLAVEKLQNAGIQFPTEG
ncbi:MAG: hypothetical protein J6023_00025 [Clostridia bacterium]|nr:hypothetical protein [Clostridia bacterium]